MNVFLDFSQVLCYVVSMIKINKIEGYAIANESANGWYNAGNFVARSNAKLFNTSDNAEAVANIVRQNRKMNVRVFYIANNCIREVCKAFTSSAYRPAR